MAARLVPTKQQLAWQQLELTAFIHFGINTFTGKEQGDGKEFPVMFNPVALDAEQWVKALKAGGLKSVVLTAKHHDGFCLWPTKNDSSCHHGLSVEKRERRCGSGIEKACDRNGMRFGIYLSLLDRNISYYGDSPRYNEFS